jgi:hypothetical protein
MSCGICGRREVSGSCQDGYVVYLSGDYPCVFNKQATGPRNLRELPPLQVVRRDDPAPQMRDNSSEAMSSEGLEDLL